MRKIMLGFITLLLMSTMAFAQSSAVTLITVEALSIPLLVTPEDGGVLDVIRGVTYQVVYDVYALGSVVYPNFNGEAPLGDVGINISAEPSTNIVVEMQLPDDLLGIAGTSMPIFFPSTGPGGGIRVENGEFFNPHVSNVFNSGTGGATSLRVGYVFTVPPNTAIASDVYTGQIFSNVYYTGM